MVRESVERVLSGLNAGEVRLATGRDVGGQLARLSHAANSDPNGGRLVVVAWEQPPRHPRMIEEALDRLAEAVLWLWPDWYLRAQDTLALDSTLDRLCARSRLAGLERQVLPHWLKLADRACSAQRKPRWPGEFTTETEARQLSLALGDCDCRLVLAVAEVDQDDQAHLVALARTAESLAHATRLPVLVLAPAAALESRGLDSISFQSVPLEEDRVEESYAQASTTPSLPEPAHSGAETAGAARATRPHSRLVVQPIVGRPHPASPGEQILWNRLESDAELAGLFCCNAWIETSLKTFHLVDYIWSEGKLVVEVDGYQWHASPTQFALDRRRDYELQLSGHLVLRLPHSEVLADLEGAVEKIRRMVRYRCAQGD